MFLQRDRIVCVWLKGSCFCLFLGQPLYFALCEGRRGGGGGGSGTEGRYRRKGEADTGRRRGEGKEEKKNDELNFLSVQHKT